MAPKLQQGDKIWQYEIDGFLGEGAFAATYLAHHQTMRKRKVAIKQLKRSRLFDSSTVKRFVREAYAMGELCHPNIVLVHELIDPEVYPNESDFSIVMEYMDGGTLEDWMERDEQPLNDISNAVRVVQSILEGLSAAHHEKIFHRDIKPANILLSHDGSQVKLGDWGLAQFDNYRSTTFGVRMGTPAYMAPEQASGDSRDVDARSDLYAVGAVLYEILTGHRYINLEEIFNEAIMRYMEQPLPGQMDQRTIEGLAVEAMFKAIQKQEPDDPRAYRSELPDPLCRILMKSLAKERANRYQSSTDFITALKEIPEDGKKGSSVVLVNENDRMIAPLLVRARQQRLEQNYSQAVSLLEQARGQSPYHPGVCLELARIHNQMRQYEIAEAILMEARQKNPDNYVILRDLGYTLSSQRKNRQALEVFEEALCLNRNQADVIRVVNRLKRIVSGV
jgi:serine/threonine protein kinase